MHENACKPPLAEICRWWLFFVNVMINFARKVHGAQRGIEPIFDQKCGWTDVGLGWTNKQSFLHWARQRLGNGGAKRREGERTFLVKNGRGLKKTLM